MVQQDDRSVTISYETAIAAMIALEERCDDLCKCPAQGRADERDFLAEPTPDDHDANCPAKALARHRDAVRVAITPTQERLRAEQQARRDGEWAAMLAARGWSHLDPDEVDRLLESERLEKDWLRDL